MQFPERLYEFLPVSGFERKLVSKGEDVIWRNDIGRINQRIRQPVADEMGQGPFIVLDSEFGHAEIKNGDGTTAVVPCQWLEPNCDPA